jgi:glycosyltransferase involved in cell wall biosynthesis
MTSETTDGKVTGSTADRPATAGISLVVITKNEARNLPGCLASAQFVDEIVIVDAGSSDATQDIAGKAGARVIEHPFDGYAAQRQRAMDAATRDWIFWLDADERATPELAADVMRIVRNGDQTADAFAIPRRHYFLGDWLRYGGEYPAAQIRLIRRDVARLRNDLVHEVIEDRYLKVRQLESAINHFSSPSLRVKLAKLRRYARLSASQRIQRGEVPSTFELLTRPARRVAYVYIRARAYRDGWRGVVWSLVCGFEQVLISWHLLAGRRDESSREQRTTPHAPEATAAGLLTSYREPVGSRRQKRVKGRIAFAAQALAEPSYGIGRYTRNLLWAMSELDDVPDLTLFYAGRRRIETINREWRHRWLPLPQRTLHALSVVGPFPIETMIGAHQLVHSPDSIAVHTRSPLVVTVHDLIVFRMPQLFPAVYTADRNHGYRTYQEGARSSIPRAAHLICVSETTRRDLLELFQLDPSRVTVIPYGAPTLPPSFQRQSRNGGSVKVLLMGRVEHRKNLPTAIAALAQLRRDGMEVELVVCGDASVPEAARVRAECDTAGAGAWVKWRGHIEGDAIWREYADADALVYPSWYEGFGMPPFEAFAAGVPVVASNTSSLGELLQGAAILCDPRSPKEFAAALARVLTDTAERERLVAAGHARAAQFTWRRAAQQTVAVYERVAESGTFGRDHHGLRARR